MIDSKDLPKLGAPKFCVDCAHSAESAEGLRCKREEYLDVVTGKPFNPPCAAMRYEPNAPCGMDAKGFEAKRIIPA